MPTFGPSDVYLMSPIPLSGTLNKAELEVAAAIIVLACQSKGEWGAVTVDEMLRASQMNAHRWLSNPFLVPDFTKLAAHGYAVITGEKDPERTIQLTEACFEKIARWVRDRP